ncbi:MAG: hypothetical protein RL481_1396 [Pseudomonadota bacterium]|jgi:hypothetical protein
MHSLSRLIVLGASLALSACNSDPIAEPAKAASAASANNPVVVELFQSQGCSSCPPANAALNAIADRKDVIALSFAVTYWDQLGWKDRFATPAFTQRQRDYDRGLRGGGVYTPQVVLNGSRAIVGNGKGELAKAISETAGVSAGPEISINEKSAIIGKGSGKATAWLVRFDPKVRDVAIKSGENGGRKLPHRNIVRQLVRLGDWKGKSVSFTLPAASEAGLRTAILLQSGTGGPILAAKAD